MIKTLVPIVVAFSLIVLLNGCIDIGSGPKYQHANATLGQQLIDLKQAQALGAITEAEYQVQKVKLLGSTPENPPAK